MKQVSIFTDGGARGNPGPAAVGFLVKDSQGKILVRQGKCIGRATNNVAEYTAVIEALKWLIVHCKLANFNFFLDSKLVVNQLNGLYKIKNAKLRLLVIKVRGLEEESGRQISYRFISREKNQEADWLVNQSFENEKNFAFKK